MSHEQSKRFYYSDLYSKIKFLKFKCFIRKNTIIYCEVITGSLLMVDICTKHGPDEPCQAGFTFISILQVIIQTLCHHQLFIKTPQ